MTKKQSYNATYPKSLKALAIADSLVLCKPHFLVVMVFIPSRLPQMDMSSEKKTVKQMHLESAKDEKPLSRRNWLQWSMWNHKCTKVQSSKLPWV